MPESDCSSSVHGEASVSSLESNPNQDEIRRLHVLCDEAEENNMESWNAIRQWIESHQNQGGTRLLEDAARTKGEYNTTPLHMVCRKCPPVDIIETLLGIASDTVAMSDSFGWLPLHYACANGASEDVLRVLCKAYPESRNSSDKRGRTPLHFALGNTSRRVSPEAVELLAASGAASHPDEDALLPLHYACAYGISREALLILIDADPDYITGIDNKGRTPLHFALGNAARESSPSVVALLLNRSPTDVDNSDNDGKPPLDLLAHQSHRLEPDDKDGRKNVVKCLLLCLSASKGNLPDINQLPLWLGKEVQHILVRKISEPFPTAILLLDFYMYIFLIISFSIATDMYIQAQLQSEHASVGIEGWFIVVIFVAIVYFVLREIMQIFSQKRAWFHDTWNCLDVANIVLVVISAIIMRTGNGEADKVRILLMVTNGLVWIMMVRYLKSFNQSFAIFVSAVIHIACKLSSFFIAVGLIILSFAHMYYIGVSNTEVCSNEEIEAQKALGELTFCSLRESYKKTFAMFIGDIEEVNFTQNSTITGLSVVYGILVVILLLNVLIAVVNESYEDVRNKGKAYFHSNRFAFLAEVGTVARFFHRRPLKKDETAPISYWDSFQNKLESWWDISIKLFDDQELNYRDGEFYTVNFFRIFFLLLLLFWIILGLATCGFLWPQQVRSWFLNGKHDSEENDLGTKNTRNWDSFQNKLDSWWDISIKLFDDQELNYRNVKFYTVNIFRIFFLLLSLFWIILGLVTCGLLWPQQVRSGFLNIKNDSEENDLGTKNTDDLTTDMLNLIQEKDTYTNKNGNMLQQGLRGDENYEEITKHFDEMKNAMENQKKDISAILENQKKDFSAILEKQKKDISAMLENEKKDIGAILEKQSAILELLITQSTQS